MSKHKRRKSGRGLCGSIRGRIAGPLRPTVIACHCRNCRRFSGELVTATATRNEHRVITKKGSLKWCKSAKHNKQGFCAKCGSSLFRASDQWPYVSMSARPLNEPTGLKLAVRHTPFRWRVTSRATLISTRGGAAEFELLHLSMGYSANPRHAAHRSRVLSLFDLRRHGVLLRVQDVNTPNQALEQTAARCAFTYIR